MILVTGGAGFIGTNLILELNRRGINDVVICDTMLGLGTNRCGNLEKLRYDQLVNPWGIMDWLETGRKLDYVIHLGAITDTMRNDPEMFVTNYAFSVDLFLWCTRHRVPLIYASSAAVYGAGLHGFTEDRYEHHLRPLNHYGWSKQAFDVWVARHGARRNDHPPGCVGLRFFNVYGPYEQHKKRMASMISQMIGKVSRDEPVNLFRSPIRESLRRDFVHVDDVVSVILWFMERDDFGIFNVGTGTAHTFEEALTHVGDVLGKTPMIKYTDMPEEVRKQYQYETRADLRKLRHAGYTAGFIELGEGVRRTVNGKIISSIQAAE